MYLLCLVYLLLECGDGIGIVFLATVGVCSEHIRFAALLLLHMRVVFVVFTSQICIFKEINT